MTLSQAQIRAANALLGIKTNIVAADLNVSHNNLTKFLNPDDPKDNISKSILDKLDRYYANKRIVFAANDTVGKKPTSDFEVLHGSDGFKTLMDDVYEVAKTTGGALRIINGHPKLFIKFLGEVWYAAHVVRMEEFKDNIDFKIIAVADGGEIAGKIAEYRFIDEEFFFNNTIYIFGNTVASIYFNDDDVEIEILNRERLAQTWLHQFDIDWIYYSEKK